MKIIEFDVPLFEEKILICIDKNVEVLKKIIPKLDLDVEKFKSYLGLAFTGIHKDKLCRRIIWLRKWNLSTLIHEAYHVTDTILSHVGVTDKETGAYLMELIYRETIKGKKSN